MDREDEERISERLTQQLAQQWALIRAERERREPLEIEAGPSNMRPARVPFGVDLAAAWGWRVLVIGAAGYGILWLLAYFAVITIPLAVSVLVAALGGPGVRLLSRARLPRQLSALLVVVGVIGVVVLLLTFVGRQVAEGAEGVAEQVVIGLDQIERWLRDGPLGISESQLSEYIQEAQRSLTESTRGGEVLTQVTQLGIALGNAVAGFFIILLASYFFMSDGDRIWSWVVRLAPRNAREEIDASGRIAWRSLTQFVRATVVIALADAIGVMIVAGVLGVPFVLAIGVLVFLGAFVPLIGATIAGSIAVLVALVDQGPLTALLMLGGLILVQQIEGNLLQPFLMGSFVAVHPLGVLVAIGLGVVAAGVAGALVAVPLAAAANSVVLHLAEHSRLAPEQEEEWDEPPTANGRESPDQPETAAPAGPGGDAGGKGAT